MCMCVCVCVCACVCARVFFVFAHLYIYVLLCLYTLGQTYIFKGSWWIFSLFVNDFECSFPFHTNNLCDFFRYICIYSLYVCAHM